MENLRAYLLRNFEQAFVLSILVSVSLITYYIPYKLAFLNMYYIPILLAGYYLGTRAAMLGALLSIILVGIYAFIYTESFVGASSNLDLVANIMTWGCFLILSGAVVGYLNRELKERMYAAARLGEELTDNKALLEKTTTELIAYADNMDGRVAERTDTLEKSKRAVEEFELQVEEALYSTMDQSVVKLIIEKRLRTEKRE